ncbi:hypothetical protein HMI56_006116 [Coelomomyces lativittatus]|nr:hypothetical protein HMI56_006116 [Coelomomyces lativittatus]
MRLPILKHYRALDIPTTSDYQRFHAWVDACSQLPSVKHSTSDMNMLIQFYAAMAN